MQRVLTGTPNNFLQYLVMAFFCEKEKKKKQSQMCHLFLKKHLPMCICPCEIPILPFADSKAVLETTQQDVVSLWKVLLGPLILVGGSLTNNSALLGVFGCKEQQNIQYVCSLRRSISYSFSTWTAMSPEETRKRSVSLKSVPGSQE